MEATPASLPRQATDARIALLVALTAFLALVPFHRGTLRSTDEVGLFEITRSLAERGSFEVPRQQHVFRGRDGRLYHQYEVGQAVLALPFYALGALAERVLPERVSGAFSVPDGQVPGRRVRGGAAMYAVGLFPFATTGALAGVFFLFERRLGASRRTAALLSLLLGTCTYAAVMASFYMRHATTAVAVLGALLALHVWRRGGHTRALAVASGLSACLILVRMTDALASAVLGIALLFALHERAVWRLPRGRQARIAAAVVLPFLGAGAAHLALNVYRWGSWIGSPLVEAGTFSTPLWISGYANLASPGMSIFLYSPLLLLTPFAFGSFLRRHRLEATSVLALCGSFFVVFSWYDGWAGQWTMPGPRYLFLTVPLGLLPLGPWLEEGRRPRRWLWVAALAALGLLVQGVFLTVSWADLVLDAGWMDFEPRWGFLFVPQVSPPAEAIRALLDGRGLDPWLLELARGGPGLAPRPGPAAALLGVWAVGLLAVATPLVRALGGPDPAPRTGGPREPAATPQP